MALFDMGLTVDTEDLVYYLTDSRELSYDDLIELIVAIDEQMVDWDFTKKLYKHFKKLNEIRKAEDSE